MTNDTPSELERITLAAIEKDEATARHAVEKQLPHPRDSGAYASFDMTKRRLDDGKYLVMVDAALNPGYSSPATPGASSRITRFEAYVNRRV